MVVLLVGAIVLGLGAVSVLRRPSEPDTPRRTDANAMLDLAYGDHPRQVYDVFVPAEGAGPFPAVVWIHGGGWRIGDKTESMPVWDWTDDGYVIVAINYRLTADGTTIGDATADAIAAVRHVLANAGDHSIDPERVGVYGFSAGGHLAAMVGQADLGVAAVVVSGAPTDFEPLIDPTRSVFEQRPPDEAAATIRARLGCDADCDAEVASLSPARLPPGPAPVLIVHGDLDPFVDVSQARIFGDSLARAGADADVVVIDGGRHRFLAVDRIEGFFAQRLAR